MAPNITIDFHDIEGTIPTGRARGAALRIKYNLDAVDRTADPVSVLIPSSTFAVTSSFFFGLFGPSVIAAGSCDAFFRKYEFSAKPKLTDAFLEYAGRALLLNALYARAGL